MDAFGFCLPRCLHEELTECHFSLQVDETSVDGEPYLGVMVRYVPPGSWRPISCCIGFPRLSATDAQTMVKAIFQSINHVPSFDKHVLCLMTDNCNTMRGKQIV